MRGNLPRRVINKIKKKNIIIILDHRIKEDK